MLSMCACIYVFFISQPQQHNSNHKNTIKAEKSSKKMMYIIERENNTLYRYNKRYYNLHFHCTLNDICTLNIIT